MNGSFYSNVTMMLMAAALLTFSSCSSVSLPPPTAVTTTTAYAEGIPGGVMVNAIEMSARVSAIDHVKRTATLLRSDDTSFTVKAGPEVINFDQIGLGDLVNLAMIEEIAVYSQDAKAPAVDQSAVLVARAPKGAAPGGLMADTVQTVATVTAIDTKKRTATLRFQDDSEKTFAVRDDIDLTKHKIGEKVVFEVTEVLAIDVSKQQ